MENMSEIYFLLEPESGEILSVGTMEDCKKQLKLLGELDAICAADQYVIAKMVPLRYNEKGEIIEEI